MKRQVFFSFQYKPDNWRASMVRNMGKVDNSSTFSDNDWEEVRRKSNVYERIGEDEYWYVDNFHKDGSVHLEVFRMSDGMFIGTCDIEDVNKFRAATKNEAAKKEPLKF